MAPWAVLASSSRPELVNCSGFLSARRSNEVGIHPRSRIRRDRWLSTDGTHVLPADTARAEADVADLTKQAAAEATKLELGAA
jgi:hypothetical protein